MDDSDRMYCTILAFTMHRHESISNSVIQLTSQYDCFPCELVAVMNLDPELSKLGGPGSSIQRVESVPSN